MWTGDGQWFPCLVAAGLSRIGTARRTTATSEIMVRHIDFSDTKKVTGRQWEGDGGGGGGHSSGEYSTLTLHHTVISTDWLTDSDWWAFGGQGFEKVHRTMKSSEWVKHNKTPLQLHGINKPKICTCTMTTRDNSLELPGEGWKRWNCFVYWLARAPISISPLTSCASPAFQFNGDYYALYILWYLPSQLINYYY